MGLLQSLLARVPRAARYRVITLCGLICLFAPLALWVAMAVWGMRLVLAIWLTAIIVLSLMIWSSPDERI